MVLEAILNMVQKLLFGIFSFINLPEMPEVITNAFSSFLTYLNYGTDFIGFFIPGSVVKPFFAVFFIIFAIDHGYPFIMWILRKIPMLNIS